MSGEGCPEDSSNTNQDGDDLNNFAVNNGDGVVYDGASAKLRLKKEGANFAGSSLTLSDPMVTVVAADFDGDGWVDLVGGTDQSNPATMPFNYAFYKNETYDNPEPDWSDPTDPRQAKFTRTTIIQAGDGVFNYPGLTAGDYDNDGNADFVAFRNSFTDIGLGLYSPLEFFHVFLGNGNGTFQAPYDGMSDVTPLGSLTWGGTNAVSIDWNGDGWLDIVFGSTQDADYGHVHALINSCPDAFVAGVQCSQAVTFVPQLLANNIDTVESGYTNRGAVAIGVADYTGDGALDVIVGSPSSASLRLFPRQSDGTLGTPHVIPSVGGITAVLSGDITLTGDVDIVVGTDNWNYPNTSHGGKSYFYRNDGDADSDGQPFDDGFQEQLTDHDPSNVYDFDLAVLVNYDGNEVTGEGDPDQTKDFFFADGNHSVLATLFANRVVTTFVPCGTVYSGVLDLGSLEDVEFRVTAAKIKPDHSLPSNTTIAYELANADTDPPNWTLATAANCPADTAAAGFLCANFGSSQASREIRWRATMCTTDPSVSPTISGVEVGFVFSKAVAHYTAGVIVHDGVMYLGGQRQPGSRGIYVAVSADFDEVYWNAQSKLDEQVALGIARNLYTSTASDVRLDFDSSGTDLDDLVTVLGVGTVAQAQAVIDWQGSARFGLGNTGIPLTRLGPIIASTSAILTPPGQPIWAKFATPAEQSTIAQFISQNKDRVPLALVGSQDGPLHAFYTDALNISDVRNGREAWGYLPRAVVSGLAADRAANEPNHFVDGSPRLADIIFPTGHTYEGMQTVAIFGSGQGGTSITALRVTETVVRSDPSDPASPYIVNGPDPLWEITPEETATGWTATPPIIARTKIGIETRYVAVLASGKNPNDPDKGRRVIGVDIVTGDVLWKFEALCPVTSNLVGFETNDELEQTPPGMPKPKFDGYLDRVVFADDCGHVYKLAPGQDLGGATLQGLGTIVVPAGDLTYGGETYPHDETTLLFSSQTVAAIGERRPITGTLATIVEPSSTRLMLLFGTGGDPSFDPTKENEFYAVFADNGEIRLTIHPGCETDTSGTRCYKYYNNIVTTNDTFVVPQVIDPPVGATDDCDTGKTQLRSYSVTADTDDPTPLFDVDIGAAIIASLYFHGNALYASSFGGQVVRIGVARAARAGDDTRAGTGDLEGEEGEEGQGGVVGGAQPQQVTRWWRQMGAKL